MSRDLIYSLRKKDFIVQPFKGSGAGGQHRNKNSTAIRIIHLESGAKGESQELKSQHQNKKLAFERLVESKEFQIWHKRKIAESLLDKEKLQKKVDDWMKPDNMKVEYYDPNNNLGGK